MKICYKIFLLLFCSFALSIFPQPKNNFQRPTQWQADSSNQYPVYQPKVGIPHSGRQKSDLSGEVERSETKRDYRNHINLPEYDPSLILLKTVHTGTGVWTELNPKVPRVDYLGIHFINKDIGWACGANGALIKTTDGGKKWKWIELTTTAVLKTVGSYNGETVITAGDNGTVLLSTDLGETWQPLNLNTTINFWNVEFINENLAWLVGENGGCYKTTDGGFTWQSVSTPLGSLPHWDVDFLNTDYGFICSDGGKVIRTTDGGNSWQLLQAGDDYALYTIAIADSLNISAGGVMVKFVHSSDGGNTWSQSGLQGDPYVNKIKFVNDSLGYATGLITFPYRTTNQGRTWFAIGQNIGEWNITFTNGGVGFSVGNNLKLTKTTNSGFSWTQTIINDDFYDVYFVNETKGFAISGAFYQTTDGGINWERNYNGPGGYVITFIDSLTGFVGTTQSKIFRTTDGGQVWNLVNIIGLTDTMGGIVDIFFLNESLGWAVTTRGGIVKTTNSGYSWFAQLNAGTSGVFQSVYFINPLNGWVISPGFGGIYNTIDGGINWIRRTDIPIYDGSDIYFLDSIGFVINFLELYKTKDSGNNWFTQLSSQYVIRSFGWLSTSNGFIIGDGVYKTIDSGNTWDEILELRNIGLRKFHSPKNYIGYAVGFSGLMYKYVDTAIVPVELTSFDVEMNCNKVTLKWTTATETNNRGFEILKSSDKQIWEAIAFIEGKGSTSSPQNYTCNDEISESGIYYYQLKQIDYDGTFNFSQIIEARVAYPSNYKLFQNYPNPFNATTKIQYDIPSDTKVQLKIYDILGREVKTLVNEFQTAGRYNVEFNAANLASGVYIYQLSAQGFVKSRKMMVIK